MGSAHRQAVISAGAEDDPGKLLRRRTLRVEGLLREIAQNAEVGPIPPAAAHTAEGLQRLLEVCTTGQKQENASPESMMADVKAAREALSYAAETHHVQALLEVHLTGRICGEVSSCRL
jgi:hypothetical protein